MNVPKNANVRMTPKFLKKFSYMSAQLERGFEKCDKVGHEAEERGERFEGRKLSRRSKGGGQR